MKSTDKMSSIHLDHVTCQTDEKIILNDISTIIEHKRTAIIGANGSGKSTFIRLLNGLILPDAGKVSVDGLWTHSHDITTIRKNIGFMFQNPEHQIIWPAVKEDLTFSLKNHHFPPKDYDSCIDDILGKLKISHLKNALIHGLSGGEKQLVALAALLIIKPHWLIFDEPTAMLDFANETNIKKQIASLKQKVVVVTHDLNWAKSFEHILWIKNGKIVQQGGPQVVDDYINHEITA